MLKRSVPVFNVLNLMFEKFKGPKELRQERQGVQASHNTVAEHFLMNSRPLFS